jgi:hypothetical protein
MAHKIEKKDAPGRGVLGPTYEPGKPEGESAGRWRYKLRNREERLKYLAAGERYWYSKEWFGSEKRNSPA